MTRLTSLLVLMALSLVAPVAIPGRWHGETLAINDLSGSRTEHLASSHSPHGAHSLAAQVSPDEGYLTYLPVISRVAAASPAPAPVARPTLLASYSVGGPQPDYALLRYRPRQMAAGLDVDVTERLVTIDDPGPYAGWDVLNTPGDGVNAIMGMDGWLVLRLNRPAQVAVVWRGGTPLPAWLSGWSQGPSIVVSGQAVPTYRRAAAAGELRLGAVYDTFSDSHAHRLPYLVLFAEENGQPSAAPAVPEGLQVPQANAACPSWVHDRYVTRGPDGKLYPTWHPQIDPVYWCYFGHEHGSDPGLFAEGRAPAYGYTAAQHGMEEPHVGFKSYVLDDRSGHQWLITHHFGTGGLGRACERFHTLELAVKDKASGELLADVRLMADFGPAIVNTTQEPLRPTACPDQAERAIADDSKGVRQLPVASREGNPYEPWRPDFSRTILGLKGSLVINTPEGVVICADVVCDTAAPAPGDSMGVFRFLMLSGPFGFKDAPHTGTFFTDPLGRTLVSPETPGALRQYVAPGLEALFTDLVIEEECYPLDAWRSPYACSLDPTIHRYMSLEDGIRAPN